MNRMSQSISGCALKDMQRWTIEKGFYILTHFSELAIANATTYLRHLAV